MTEFYFLITVAKCNVSRPDSNFSNISALLNRSLIKISKTISIILHLIKTVSVM